MPEGISLWGQPYSKKFQNRGADIEIYPIGHKKPQNKKIEL